jgi:hypothetical protein
VTTAPHVLVVTVDPDDEESVEARVECPGVSSNCRAWFECEASVCLVHPDRYDCEPMTSHGQVHQRIDGQWMVPTEKCLTGWHDDAATDLAHDLGVGRHPVDVEWDDGLYLHPISEA